MVQNGVLSVKAAAVYLVVRFLLVPWIRCAHGYRLQATRLR